MGNSKIDLYATLRETERKGVKTGAFQISITAPTRIIDTDDKQINKIYAAQVAEQIKEGLRRGEASDGQNLGGVAASTIANREDRQNQGRHGGEPVRRKAETKAKQNFKRQFTFKRQNYQPETGKPRGNLSGILVDGIRAVVRSDGKGFLVFVPANRGKPKPGEALSALQTVLNGKRVWSAAASAVAGMEEARKMAAGVMLGKAPREFGRLLKNLGRLLKQIEEFGGE